MENMITLIIPGEPIAQPRAKATTIGNHARMYTPTKNGISVYKAEIRMVAAQHYSGPPLDCPVRIDNTWVFTRPGRLVWKTKPMPRLPHTSLRDRDNLDKAVLDALTGVMLKNDKIVYSGRVQKFYAAGDEQPHTEIVISW
jgi:Holliday junction resolvase RusA-like endonuclease